MLSSGTGLTQRFYPKPGLLQKQEVIFDGPVIFKDLPAQPQLLAIAGLKVIVDDPMGASAGWLQGRGDRGVLDGKEDPAVWAQAVMYTG